LSKSYLYLSRRERLVNELDDGMGRGDSEGDAGKNLPRRHRDTEKTKPKPFNRRGREGTVKDFAVDRNKSLAIQ
jgi:hypothetical protein